MNNDYYKNLNDMIKKYCIDFEEVGKEATTESNLMKEDLFEEHYKEFFIDRLLKDLIENYIKGININNASTAKNVKTFEIRFIEEIQGHLDFFQDYLTYRKCLYAKTNQYMIGYNFDLEDEKGNVCFNKEDVINYILGVLNTKEYEIQDIHQSEWEDIVPKRVSYGGPYNKPKSSFEKKEMRISFNCTIEQLINMYNMETMRYSYIYDADNYRKESDAFQERIKKI